jgi:hypothetical protein
MAQPNRVKANTKYTRGVGFGKKAQKQVPTTENHADTHTVLSTELTVLGA